MKLDKFLKEQKGSLIFLLDFLFVALGVILLLYLLFKDKQMIRALFGR